nr:MAG TPA: ATP-binding sugar transporter [Caudoviricetes sp.]
MTFKDMATADVASVFLNPDEFGETHNLDGVSCICVVSRDETEGKSAALPGGRRTPDGLHGDYLTVCVKKSDLRRIPKQGENFKVDDKRYTVDSCSDDMGMLTITMGAYRMGGSFL